MDTITETPQGSITFRGTCEHCHQRRTLYPSCCGEWGRSGVCCCGSDERLICGGCYADMMEG